MDPDNFINAALSAGGRNGVEALDSNQRVVFLISEAEVYCAMEGIDGFLNRYSPKWLAETADAFAAVGALEIADGLRAIGPDTPTNDLLLDRVNDLINRRAGYDYEPIRQVVQSRLPVIND